jgi:hypothetical protein
MNTVSDNKMIKNPVLNGVLLRGLTQMILVCAVVALAACNPGRLSREFDDDEVRDIGNSHVNEIEASVDSMSLGDAVTVVNTDPIEIASGDPDLSVAALPPGCRTVIVGSTTDTDTDGVPDDVTFRFDANKCTRPFLGGTRTWNGDLRIQDLKPSVPDRSYQETLTNLTRITQFVSTTTERRNGTRSLINFGGTALTKTYDVILNLNLPGIQFDLFVRNRLNLTFTATGGTIQIGQPLPAGSLSIQGSTEWARGLQPLRSFTVSTSTALTYSPSCANQKNQSFTAGELRLTRPSGTQINILFKPCGTPPEFTQTP